MKPTVLCPQCGRLTVSLKEHCIQEIDCETPSFKPARILAEFECQECGWLAASFGTAA